MLQVQISGLQPGLHTVALHPTPDDLDLDPDAFRDLHVTAHLDVEPRRILVTLDATATASLVCDRTLVTFDQHVEGHHTVLFAATLATPEDDDDPVDLRPLSPSDQALDLTDAVRDTLLLALPLRRIAPGAEALELPTQFGNADGVDPRWEALKALRTPHSDS